MTWCAILSSAWSSAAGGRPIRSAAESQCRPRRVSACSVVAAALKLEGMAMSEANVVQLWKAMPD
jgi:hypothetical protein